MYAALRALLFQLDPERAHSLTLEAVAFAGKVPPARAALRALWVQEDPRLAVEAFGVTFPNPVGLAAGYDKNGVAVAGLSALGFGHLEIGTITPVAQPGNPRPRLHRLPEAGAIINSMGFPNDGAAAIDGRAWRREARGARIGVNLGKGKDTPLERAADDYVSLLKRYAPSADYVTINISSPNTPALRELQTRAFITDLLRTIAAERDRLTPRVPILVKIAPDLCEHEIDDVVDAIFAAGFDGIVATNTTLSREGLPESTRSLPGGLSGQPLKARATAAIRHIAKHTGGKLPIVGVGGIASAVDAMEKLDAGACLIQIYTGLVYAGPGLVRTINRVLLEAKTPGPG